MGDKNKTLASATEPLLTRNELAAVLRVSNKTISRLVAAGDLPAPIRVGRHYRWRRADVEKYIAAAGERDGAGPDEATAEG